MNGVAGVTEARQLTDPRPGFTPARLARLARRAVADLELDLTGRVVLTEAATGAYVVTPVIAALAGAARVIALAKETRYGTVENVRSLTDTVARTAGTRHPIEIVTALTPDLVGAADIVTNSGHLRPIDAEFAARLKPGAVVPLMVEGWEIGLGRADVDLAALRSHGIAHGGTNEHHSRVGVFEHHRAMVLRLLSDCGIAAHGANCVVLCDNPFEPEIVDGLVHAGAQVHYARSLDTVNTPRDVDAVIVALRPRGLPVIGAHEARRIAARWPGAVVLQVWGDIDRTSLEREGVPFWPATGPAPGHMAILPSAVGPEPIVRLQAGGLKVGQVLLMPPELRTDEDKEYVDVL
ncbi:hypothetical protein LO772_13435 [Yinghuangia sp. ASG 101]|uniref:hypothetical protein n=1 Tax=Yinghuangia sp. ASG 101 TaxID=2896848 RepID=UPI001E4BFF71|nr:hypothetical protein [Yinghuangia sp. ASG 101]UGQ14494.1 hypothetical protein LO772_13435 [Yinghuangia sp. ASG 101]